MNAPRSARIWLALSLVLFLACANVAYALLIADFGYDDVLRLPVGEVLTRFDEQRERLILEWLLFALSTLWFLPAAWLPLQWLGARGHLLAVFGVSSALLQCIALLRWPLLVPLMAQAFVSGDPLQQALAEHGFALSNQYLGVGIGEFLGQLTLVIWTAGIARLLWTHGKVARALALIGAATLPLWLLGFSELAHTLLPRVAVIETTPIAFMLWEVWLLLLALWLFTRRAAHASL